MILTRKERVFIEDWLKVVCGEMRKTGVLQEVDNQKE